MSCFLAVSDFMENVSEMPKCMYFRDSPRVRLG